MVIHGEIPLQVVTPGRRWRRMGTVKNCKKSHNSGFPPMPMESRCYASIAVDDDAVQAPSGGLTRRTTILGLQRVPWSDGCPGKVPLAPAGPPGAGIPPDDFDDSRPPIMVSSRSARRHMRHILSAHIRWLTETIYAEAFGALVEEAGNMNFEVRSEP